jgi:hypothetical protein
MFFTEIFRPTFYAILSAFLMYTVDIPVACFTKSPQNLMATGELGVAQYTIAFQPFVCTDELCIALAAVSLSSLMFLTEILGGTYSAILFEYPM